MQHTRNVVAAACVALLAPSFLGPGVRSQQEDAAQDLQRAIRLVEDGDFEAAADLLAVLTTRGNGLSSRARDRVLAYLYLGIARLYVTGEDEALAAFHDAQREAPAFQPPATEFPRRVIDVWNRARGMGTLAVVTRPAGAAVSVAGVIRGRAPVVTGLTPGEYQVTLTLDGYVEDSRLVTVAAGRAATVQAELAPAGPSAEELFWQEVADSTEPATFQAYLRQWPDGAYAARARDRMAALGRPDPSPESRSDPRSSGTVFRDCGEWCPEMVVVPAGTFRMGSAEGDAAERPVRDVRVEAFAMGRYEVTFEEWDACVAQGGCGHRPSDEGWGRGRRPVMNVTWDHAQTYVQWLSRETSQPYRLPSEAEWEYAARAMTTTPWYWGDAARVPPARNAPLLRGQCRYANGADRTRRLRLRNWPASVFADCSDGHDQPAPVGSYAPNRFGLHDMSGNVWEMVADCWHDTYAGAPSDGTAWVRGGDCNKHPARGGSYLDGSDLLRSAARYETISSGVNRYHDNRGFRVARTLRPAQD